jgi:hypothetical protein
MRRKASLLLTLTAWFFATGSQWDVAQTFAWARMFATYAQSMSVLEAAKKTFSGEELCGVCDVVQDARQSGEDEAAGATTAAKALGKLPLMIPASAVLVTAVPAPVLRPDATASPPGTSRACPPTPPPRAAA